MKSKIIIIILVVAMLSAVAVLLVNSHKIANNTQNQNTSANNSGNSVVLSSHDQDDYYMYGTVTAVKSDSIAFDSSLVINGITTNIHPTASVDNKTYYYKVVDGKQVQASLKDIKIGTQLNFDMKQYPYDSNIIHPVQVEIVH